MGTHVLLKKSLCSTTFENVLVLCWDSSESRGQIYYTNWKWFFTVDTLCLWSWLKRLGSHWEIPLTSHHVKHCENMITMYYASPIGSPIEWLAQSINQSITSLSYISAKFYWSITNLHGKCKSASSVVQNPLISTVINIESSASIKVMFLTARGMSGWIPCSPKWENREKAQEGHKDQQHQKHTLI